MQNEKGFANLPCIPGEGGPGSDQSLFPVDVFTGDNPRSAINLVPPAVKAAMLRAQKAEPDFFGMDERDLQKKVSPTPVDNRLRLSFWQEYDRTQHENQRLMSMTRVYTGICSLQYFMEWYLDQPKRVAWMLCPPSSYTIIMREALAHGIEQLRDIMSIPIRSLKTGKIDTRLCEIKLKIVAMLDQRVMGAIIQKSQSLAVNVNASGRTGQTELVKMLEEASMEEVEKRLKTLEYKLRQATPTEIDHGRSSGTQEEKEVISQTTEGQPRES